MGSYAHYIGRIFGSGDYATSPGFVNKNSITNSSQIPEFGSEGSFVKITHREYLCDILSSSTPNQFQIQNFQLNPGLSTTFPWLSSMIAGSFQQYRINGMVFEFRSTSSELSTTVNLGYVVMATDYDSADSVFSSKSQMENTTLAVSCKPSSHAIHAIECDKKQTSMTELYVRSSVQPPNTDIRLFDLGRFSIATGGVATPSAVLGELWVSYDVSAIKPILLPPNNTQLMAHYKITGVAPSLPLGTSRVATYNSFPDALVTTGTTLTMPSSLLPGTKLLVIWNCYNSTAVASMTPSPISTSTSLPLFLGFYNGVANAVGSPGNGATANTCVTETMASYEPIVGVSPTFTFGGCIPGSGALAELWIIAVNSGYTPSSVLTLLDGVDAELYEKFKNFVREEKTQDPESVRPTGCTCGTALDTCDNRGFICPLHTQPVKVSVRSAR